MALVSNVGVAGDAKGTGGRRTRKNEERPQDDEISNRTIIGERPRHHHRYRSGQDADGAELKGPEYVHVNCTCCGLEVGTVWGNMSILGVDRGLPST